MPLDPPPLAIPLLELDEEDVLPPLLVPVDPLVQPMPNAPMRSMLATRFILSPLNTPRETAAAKLNAPRGTRRTNPVNW